MSAQSRRVALLGKISRGEDAQRILDNPLFEESIQKLEETYTAAWKRASTVDAREDAHRYVSLISKLKEDLQSILLTGDLERKREKELMRGKKGLL